MSLTPLLGPPAINPYFAANTLSEFSFLNCILPCGPDCAISTLRVFYQLWQKSRRHHLNPPCLRFPPGSPLILGRITKQKDSPGKEKNTGEEGLGLEGRKLAGRSLTWWCYWSRHPPLRSNCPSSLRTRGGKVSLWCPLLFPQLNCQGLFQISSIFTISPRHSMSMSLYLSNKGLKKK